MPPWPSLTPHRSYAGSKSRSAAVSCRTKMCYPFCPKHGRHRAVKRREFITLIGGAAAWPLVAQAQQATPVVGFLRSTSLAPFESLATAFRQGLNETGFVEGQNVAVEYRYADNQHERLPALVADLLRRSVAVIVAN